MVLSHIAQECLNQSFESAIPQDLFLGSFYCNEVRARCIDALGDVNVVPCPFFIFRLAEGVMKNVFISVKPQRSPSSSTTTHVLPMFTKKTHICAREEKSCFSVPFYQVLFEGL